MGQKSDGGRNAVIWLATAYTAVIGAAAGAFVIAVASDQPRGPLLMFGGSLLGLLLLVLLFSIRWSRPANRLRMWLSTTDRTDVNDVYRAARRKAQRLERYGDNTPPSVDSVRDAADHGGAWVPHSSGTNRSPRQS